MVWWNPPMAINLSVDDFKRVLKLETQPFLRFTRAECVTGVVLTSNLT
jgi:hypothetical protein